jgi:hypothetical protein
VIIFSSLLLPQLSLLLSTEVVADDSKIELIILFGRFVSSTSADVAAIIVVGFRLRSCAYIQFGL